jgi:hypothetical protein
MISNEAPCTLYQRLDTPGVYGGSVKSLQVSRGKHPLEWKNANPGGCDRHYKVFNELNIIPEYCFGCYKVVIEPTTVMELFKLLILFEKIYLPDNNTRKCMVETRLDCSGTYKGFVYCRGLEESKEVHSIVSSAVADEISPNISITMKRGCTGYYAAYPEYSPKEPGIKPMEYNPDWRMLEEEFDKGRTYSRRTSPAQLTACPPWEVFAMTFWLGYAATIGDTSYFDIAGTVLPPIPQLKDQADKRRLHFASTQPVKLRRRAL